MSANPAPTEPIGQLYAEHNGWLRAWLQRKLGCAHRAADVSHDAFLRLLCRPGASGAEQPRALLMHIAKGLVVDHWRRQDVERAYLDAFAQIAPEYAPSAEERVMAIDALMRLDALLQGMEARTRAVFLLGQVDGLTYPEIARQLDTSLITVKRHMRKALLACLGAQDLVCT